MAKTPDKQWVKRRTEFNHDWLKNNYIPALARFSNVMDGQITDAEFEIFFIAEIFPEWGIHFEGAQLLLTDFELMMSPKCLFNLRPLSGVDRNTLSWLPDVIHLLWLSRCQIEAKIDSVREALNRADDIYRRLHVYLVGVEGSERSEVLLQIRDEFKVFNFHCQTLGSLLSTLPSKVKIV